MTKRISVLLAGVAMAACLPVPALAQDRDAGERSGDIARQLGDPMTQYMVAGAIAALSKEMLDMRIEPFVRAIESAGGGRAVRDLPPDARLADLAGPEGRDMPGKVMEQVPRLMGSVAGMAGAFEGMMPELEAMARRMKDAIPN